MKARQMIYILFVLLLTGVTLDPAPQAASAQECDFYASPNGSGDGLSEGSPFQMSNFLSMSESAIRGKSLCLLDGTYYESLNVSKSGTPSQPISIRALHDGEVTIDGEGSRIPVSISGNYIVVEGIVARNSSTYVYRITGSYNIVRRCSGYDAAYSENTGHVFGILGFYNLIEDCVASGTGRHLYMVYNSNAEGNGNVLRRCFGKWVSHSNMGVNSEFNNYGAVETIFENNIGWGGTQYASASLHANYEETYQAQNLKFLGNIIMRSGKIGLIVANTKDAQIENNLIYGNAYGVRLYSDASGTVFKNNTIMDSGNYGISSENSSHMIKNTIIFKNRDAYSSTLGSFSYTNLFGNSGGDTPPNSCLHCFSTDPGDIGLTIPDSSPMKGAGENGSDIGANVCYRYENGILTNVPLWPWPMGERIKKELGIDVMAELEQLFGPIPAECKGEGVREDINLDGSVNSLDVQLCVNVLNGWEADEDITKRADVNGDGELNTSDVRQIVNRYLQGK